MSNEIPVEVYETIAELNRKGLIEAYTKMDFDRMHRCFNRMTHALEQVDQYKKDQARKGLL